MILNVGLALILGIICALILSPLVLKLVKVMKIAQPILHYVDNHKAKKGMPTMGGIIFIFAMLVVVIIICPEISGIGTVAIVATLGYAIIGFLDDFIKIKSGDNQGLRAYQKIVSQLVIATIIAIYCYNNPYIGSLVHIPFSDIYVDLDLWAIPLYIITIIATVNAINLTDGIDGLVAVNSSIVLASFTIIILIMVSGESYSLWSKELEGLACISSALTGALLAFIVINCFPARIFMGDTGSLALGGAVAVVAIFTQNILFIPIIGFVYCFTELSVVIQVLHYKRTHKRVFLMAPFHHHLERKGIHENRIVAVYSLLTIFTSVICIIFY